MSAGNTGGRKCDSLPRHIMADQNQFRLICSTDACWKAALRYANNEVNWLDWGRKE